MRALPMVLLSLPASLLLLLLLLPKDAAAFQGWLKVRTTWQKERMQPLPHQHARSQTNGS